MCCFGKGVAPGQLWQSRVNVWVGGCSRAQCSAWVGGRLVAAHEMARCLALTDSSGLLEISIS